MVLFFILQKEKVGDTSEYQTNNEVNPPLVSE
jgi:hypothetical protein